MKSVSCLKQGIQISDNRAEGHSHSHVSELLPNIVYLKSSVSLTDTLMSPYL